jgi:hypothetical protein
MKCIIEQLNNRAECCFVYIDNVDQELKDLIYKNFLEIVQGKLEAERSNGEDKKESIKHATKYVSEKTGNTNRLGIIGELLFHSILRTEALSNKYSTLCPTIGYSDCFKGFYKGFDGCYLCDNSIWISEVKSMLKTTKLDEDNEGKVKEASKQIKNEVNDSNFDRWGRAKRQVNHQLHEIELNEKKIYELFSKSKRNSYNQMIGTLLICNDCEFDKAYILKYLDNLFHENINNQKILLICIRSYDYEIIIEFVEKEIGAENAK